MVTGGGGNNKPKDWKKKWACSTDQSYKKCWESHKKTGCQKAESKAECKTRLDNEQTATIAVQEPKGYDTVVKRFTNLQSVPYNLVKIAQYLKTKLGETVDRTQVMSNNFCTFGSFVHRHRNVQFEIVKMLVRALDLQDRNTSVGAVKIQDYKNTVLDGFLQAPKDAHQMWTTLMESTTQETQDQPSEIAAVNALLISCGVVLAADVVTKMLPALLPRRQAIVNSQWQSMQGTAIFANVQKDSTYLGAAQLASDLWVDCNSNGTMVLLQNCLDRVLKLIPHSVDFATHEPEEKEIQPMHVVTLRGPSIADQRMMHEIFGNMRANRLRYSPRQRRSSKRSSRPRQRQTRGLSQSRRPWKHRSPAMSKTRRRSLSRTNQRSRSRPRLSRSRLSQRRSSNTRRRKSNTRRSRQ